MARTRSRRSEPSPPEAVPTSSPAPGTTGAFIVTFRPDGTEPALRAFSDRAGVSVFNVDELGEEAIPAEELASEAPNIVFPEFGIAVISGDQTQLAAMAAAPEDSGILEIRPELIMQPFPDGDFPFPEVPFPGPGTTPRNFTGQGMASPDFLQGYRAGINSLVDDLLHEGRPISRRAPWPGELESREDFESLLQQGAVTFSDTQQSTWGLKATSVMESTLTGAGVKVAILDTGVDLTHPDLRSRIAKTASFVPSPFGGFLNVQDQHGHGTHCIGTVGGPRMPANGGPRYGIAFEAEIYAGRVFDNAPQPQAQERWILAGIRWAVQQGCRIISLSLGTPWELVPVAPPKILQSYEQLAEQVLATTAIIAAVGNDSNRPGQPGFRGDRPPGIKPVAIPANSTKIMGVGAVDRNMQIAAFSNRSFFSGAGNVDLVGPGFEVYSSWHKQTQWGKYQILHGTSMATPHVAGIAALIAQKRPTWTGANILNTLLFLARPLSLSSVDGGKGLVVAPASA